MTTVGLALGALARVPLPKVAGERRRPPTSPLPTASAAVYSSSTHVSEGHPEAAGSAQWCAPGFVESAGWTRQAPMISCLFSNSMGVSMPKRL